MNHSQPTNHLFEKFLTTKKNYFNVLVDYRPSKCSSLPTNHFPPTTFITIKKSTWSSSGSHITIRKKKSKNQKNQKKNIKVKKSKKNFRISIKKRLNKNHHIDLQDLWNIRKHASSLAPTISAGQQVNR